MMKIRLLCLAAAAGAALCSSRADDVVNGVHGYTPATYVRPKEPAVRERLEWFRDQKLGLMMHFGIYASQGIHDQSWSLTDDTTSWARGNMGMRAMSDDDYKRMYWNLKRCFYPTRFDPDRIASLAADNGFRYVIFTTKHHDGFCMWDTKTTDFKVTDPECPFSQDPRADVVKGVFDACRARGLGIGAYFSKPDWHNPNFWENHGIGYRTTRDPSYDIKARPEKWERFAKDTHDQIMELMNGYGPIDILWLDGCWVGAGRGKDIHLGQIVAEARQVNPGLITVDRLGKNEFENVITPEQTVPKDPIAVPWESCITTGRDFSFRFEDYFKSDREVVHLLVDVVAKGGNLALNVGPGPDGAFPREAVDRLETLGRWLKANGEAIYATRPLPPYRKGAWALTQSKDGKRAFAIRLWPTPARYGVTALPFDAKTKVASVRHLATGADMPLYEEQGGQVVRFPAGFRNDPYADAFEISFAAPDLRTQFPEITSVSRRTVGEGDGKSADVLAQWAAARDEAVKGVEGKTYTEVDFTLRPEPGSEIRCRMLLPPAEAWDGRMWGVGNSGWAGCLPRGLWRYPAVGTAVVSTDLGTGRITNDGKTNDLAWPACVIRDYDWRATHLMTEYGVRLATAFYGKAPRHRYFCGGSCGGRQAMSEAIRFPHDYDAIIANLPANGGVAKEAAMFHLRKVAYDPETDALRFTTNEMRIVADAACELKGVEVLDDPRFTEAEIDAFLARAAERAPRLKTGDLLARLKSLYMPVFAGGKCVFNGFAPGTYNGKNMGWTKFLRFANFLKGKGYAKTADYTRGTWEQFLEFAREEGPSFNACSPDLSEFRKAGGKLLMTAGLEDQTIPPYLVMDYYDTVCEADGGIEETKTYFSLWCLPGCAHGGGKGRLMTCPPNSMRIHDMLVKWREQGVRPTDVYPGWEYGDGTHPRGGFARIDASFRETSAKVE